MRLVKNKEEYWEFIRRLRNDPNVKKGFVNQEYISEDDQRKYMSFYGGSYYICLDKDEPVGYIGDISMDIRLAVDPKRQGEGIGKFMLNKFMELRPGAYARVLIDNEASRRLFLSCGFTEVHRNDEFYYFVRK